ncbi:hypothetical protein, partial [Neisseria sp. P0014.S006]|uniref:hypothetical protein n=1 Tax=Neisseria sp. P0014.S006 TaxID=3436752 RepID=UPI003F80EB7E
NISMTASWRCGCATPRWVSSCASDFVFCTVVREETVGDRMDCVPEPVCLFSDDLKLWQAQLGSKHVLVVCSFRIVLF